MKSKRGTRQSRRGLAIVEAAIIMPLMLLVILGILEYGWMFLKAAEINNAARQGARVGARSGADAADITAAVLAAMTSAGLEDSGYSLVITPDDPTTLGSGESLTVSVSVTYSNIGIVNLAMIPTPTNLQTEVVMARESP